MIAFARRTKDSERVALFVGNFSPVVRENYRIGLPRSGRWREAINTDATAYGGSGVGNMGGIDAEGVELARPAVQRRGHAAAARRDLARARGTFTETQLNLR